jgi:hypothetical protein
MPQWIFLLVVVIAAWLVLSVVGGLLVGRLIGFVERRADRIRRAPGAASRPPMA